MIVIVTTDLRFASTPRSERSWRSRWRWSSVYALVTRSRNHVQVDMFSEVRAALGMMASCFPQIPQLGKGEKAIKMRRARRAGQPASGAQVAFRRVAIGASALGALAVGATAIGALAIGALAIRALAVKRGRIQRLDIEELEVGRLHVREMVVEQEQTPRQGAAMPPP
jgi:hypothetical protein